MFPFFCLCLSDLFHHVSLWSAEYFLNGLQKLNEYLMRTDGWPLSSLGLVLSTNMLCCPHLQNPASCFSNTMELPLEVTLKYYLETFFEPKTKTLLVCV